MKAVILAGGLGTRLLPLTKKVPKVMIEIGDKPLLWYHIQLLKRHNIKDIWICLHYLPDVITNYFGNGSKFGVNINYSFEKEPLGTAGALKNSNSRIESELKKETFLVVYGDNLTNFNYSKLLDFHTDHKSFMTLGLYWSLEPWMKGVVETDKNGKVIRMVEKPPKEEIVTNQVNSGIYVCKKQVLDYIIDKGFSDFGFNVIPKIISEKKEVFGFLGDDYVQDIGTPEGLKSAKLKVKTLNLI